MRRKAYVRFHDPGATVIHLTTTAPEETSRTMSQGGGFCERHGLFNAPHCTCPSARWKPISAAFTARPASPSPARPRRRTSSGTSLNHPRARTDRTDRPGRSAAPERPEPNDPASRFRWRGWSWRAARCRALAIKPNQTTGAPTCAGTTRASLRTPALPELPEDAPNAPPVYHLWRCPTNPVYINGAPFAAPRRCRKTTKSSSGIHCLF